MDAGSALANEVESLTAIVARLEDLRGRKYSEFPSAGAVPLVLL